MNHFTEEDIDRLSRDYGKGVAGLDAELKSKLILEREILKEVNRKDVRRKMKGLRPKVMLESIAPVVDVEADHFADESEVKPERIIMIEKGARPVARIRNNEATTEFLGVSSESWQQVIVQSKPILDKVIPAVGRIELVNYDISWAGTGWLIDEDIIVTNAHVAEVFARADRLRTHFTFKPGLLNKPGLGRVDFLEEEGRAEAINHDIVEILWIAPPGDADVAFLRVVPHNGNSRLPSPVALALAPAADATIAAIGYPAKDRSIDQKRIIQIFGDGVFDKKRLAPGLLTKVSEKRIQHDCSTLGGNSGSLLVDMTTGLAVGLHQGGLLDDSANLGVPAPYLKTQLEKIKRRAPIEVNSNRIQPIVNPIPINAMAEKTSGTHTIKFNIPVEVTVNVGAPHVGNVSLVAGVPAAGGGNFESALAITKQQYGTREGVVNIRSGYRFKNGWVTDEEVIVIEVKEKLEYRELMASGTVPFPREVAGVGVDVRAAALPDPVEDLFRTAFDNVAFERPGKPAGYTEPPGYDRAGSPMYLGRVRGRRMSAIFHVSPDAGFKELKSFLGRIKSKLTATIYEWEPNHISDEIEKAIKKPNRELKMVTQRTGVGEGDATIEAVADMKERVKRKFKHVWASTRGAGRLIPNSYHLKVATRDGEEFWLSSGNWKSSNQPVKADTAGILRRNNREWHAIISDAKLASLFERYIDYDFEQATQFPTEIKEGLMQEIEFFVPDYDLVPERVPLVTYKDTLVIEDEILDIQPLLTPDRGADGQRLFLKTATEMIARATEKIYIQNQSFAFTEENNEEFDLFFETLKTKQRAVDLRIIFRDARDYGRQNDLVKQQELLERLKRFGLDVSADAVRVQPKCHTKGIIVDGKEVMLGSHNLTNGGSLFNRDASLLVRSPKVAEFFQDIFLYDWENLAHNRIEESMPAIRRANAGEATPEGFRRVSLAELISERTA